jgi:hypothetical protein
LIKEEDGVKRIERVFEAMAFTIKVAMIAEKGSSPRIDRYRVGQSDHPMVDS